MKKMKIFVNDQHGTPVVYFGNHLYYSSLLSKSARNLLDIFTMNMREEDNLIYLCDGGLEFYLKYCKDELKITYSAKTIREAISELKKIGLISNYSPNNYIVNRNLFMRLSKFVNLLMKDEDMIESKKAEIAYLDRLINEKHESLMSSIKNEVERFNKLRKEV